MVAGLDIKRICGEKNLFVEHKINDSNSASYKAGTDGFISASVTNDSDLGTTKLTYTGTSVDVEIENFCGFTDNEGVLVLEVFTVSDFEVSFDAVLGLGFGFLLALLFEEE